MSENPTHPPAPAAAPATSSSAAATSHRRTFAWLIGAGTAGFAITLSILLGRGRQVTAVQFLSAGQAAPVASARSDDADGRASRPAWVGRRQPAWASDGSKTVTFALDAISEAAGWTGRDRARPQLIARCLSGSIDVFIVTGPLSVERIGEKHTVHVQVDDGPDESQQWSESENGQELFAPDAFALAGRLAHARRLRFGFTPFHARTVAADFVLEGFDELEPVLVRTCAWHPSAAKKRS